MDPLAIHAIGPVTLSALSALRPVQVATNPANPTSNTPGSTTSAVQDLTHTLFQQALQVSTVFPLAESTTPGLGLVQAVTPSLLAALNPPQPAANTTPATDATTHATAVTATTLADTTAAATAAANPLQDVPTAQDAFTIGSSLDFALQTALRFGAGVGAPAAPALPNAGQEPGLVPDAAAVMRIQGLQAQTGGPGPEAFARNQPPIQQILHDYQAITVPQAPGQVDFLA